MSNLIAALKKLWANEPTVVLWAAAAIIVFVAAKFGIVVNQASLLEALAYDVPFLLGLLNRSRVVPLGKLRKPVITREGKGYTRLK